MAKKQATKKQLAKKQSNKKQLAKKKPTKKKKKVKKETITAEMRHRMTMEEWLEIHVASRVNHVRDILAEKGLEYFFTSPFQYRNRLIALTALITIGCAFGLGPRYIKLTNQEQQAIRQSSLVDIEGTVLTAGSFVVKPLTSSKYNDTHVLAFSITGATANGVSSISERYNILSEQFQGLGDSKTIKISHHIVPISPEQRLLLVAIQRPETEHLDGSLQLTIESNVTGDKTKPFLVHLSKNQKTTSLYDGYVNVSTLSNYITETYQQASIKTAQEELDAKMQAYAYEVERLEINGYTPNLSVEDMNSFIKAHMLMSTITDDSTTDDAILEQPTIDIPKLELSLSRGGLEFSTDSLINGSDEWSTEQTLNDYDNQTNIASYKAAVDNLTRALTTLNRARQIKNTELVKLYNSLSTELDISQFVDDGTLKKNITRESDTVVSDWYIDEEFDDIVEQ